MGWLKRLFIVKPEDYGTVEVERSPIEPSVAFPPPAPSNLTSGSEKIYRPSKKKQALNLLLCIGGFVADFLLPTARGIGWHFLFWGLAISLTLGSLYNLAHLLFTKAAFMRVDKEGFAVCSMWQTRFYRWNEIEHFGAAELKSSSDIIPVLALKLSPLSPSKPGSQTFAEQFHRASLPDGFDVTFAPDYGTSQQDFQELARQLNEFKQRYAGSSDTTSPA